MFYLPVFVNQSRFHYCKLQLPGSTDSQVEFSFVVRREEGHGAELVRIFDGSDFISTLGTASDLTFQLKNLSIRSSFKPGNPGEIELSIAKQEGGSQVFDTDALNAGLQGTEFRWAKAGGDLFLSYQGQQSGTFRLSIDLDPGTGKNYHSSFLLHVGPAKTIFDAVFDFGSEASQIAVHQRGTEPSPEPRINLVDRMIFDFYAPALRSGRLTRNPQGPDGPEISISKVDRKRFMAFDHSHDGRAQKEYFNSSFFVLRSYGCSGEEKEDNPQARPYAEGDQEWVSLLGDTYDYRYMAPKSDRDYEIVPNLKLAELRLSRDFSLCYQDRNVSFSKDWVQKAIFRRVLVEFLHLLLLEIEQDHPQERCKLLKLTVLVPNIYSQLRVSTLIRNLYEDLRTIIDEQGYGFAGVEVQTLSESDAALLGLVTDPGIEGLDHNMLKKGDHCLVIDSGKGTTDISVLSVGADRNYSSIFRSGFAGAGNALTYAFADTLFAAIAGPENMAARENFISKFLDDQGDLGLRYLFHRALEAIKKNYSKRHQSGYAHDFAAFAEIFSGLHPKDDRQVIVQKLEEQFAATGKTFQDYFGIVDATIDLLVQKTVDLVAKSTEKKFAAVILSGRSFLMDDYREKLEKALREQFGVGKVIYQPNNLKRSCLLGPLNHPQGTNLNSDLVGTPVFSKGPATVKKLFSLVRPKKANPGKRHTATKLHEENFYLDGEYFDPNSQTLSICGKEPVLQGLPSDEEVHLAFVGENFLLRTESACIEANFGHSTGATIHTDPLAWMSQFPHMSLPAYLSPAKLPTQVAATASRSAANPAASPPEVQPVRPTVESSSPYPNDDMWDHI